MFREQNKVLKWEVKVDYKKLIQMLPKNVSVKEEQILEINRELD